MILNNSNYSTSDPSLSHIPPSPQPTNRSQRISHSLPLPFHLIYCGFYIFFSVLAAGMMHLFKPVKEEWTFLTTLAHSAVRSILVSSSPQGRHSMGIIRFLTKFKIPDWVFPGKFEHAKIIIDDNAFLSAAVYKALDLDASNLKFIPHERTTLSGEWIENNASKNSKNVILFLHGGAHIFLSPNTHRVITTRLSQNCDAKVFALDYRLAPEAPFPSAIEDALAAYVALVKPFGFDSNCHFEGNYVPVTPNKLIVMGDSSGGCLSLQLLGVINKLGLPMPAGCVLISPFIDHEMKSESWYRNWHSDFLSLDMAGVKWAMEIYSNGVDPGNHRVSPIHASLENFPPILIQAGDSEVVTDDSLRLFQKSSKFNTSIELQLYKDMFHVFHTFPFLKQSTYAFERIGIFFKLHSCSEDDDSGISLDRNAVRVKRTAILINRKNECQFIESI